MQTSNRRSILLYSDATAEVAGVVLIKKIDGEEEAAARHVLFSSFRVFISYVP